MADHRNPAPGGDTSAPRPALLAGPGLLAFAFAVACDQRAPAVQEAGTVLPDAYHCTLENDRIRVCEVKLAPGASADMHAHPEHVAYMITGGRLLITTPDGKSSEWTSRPGYTALAPAERHALRNVGEEEVRGVIVEFLAPSTAPAGSPR